MSNITLKVALLRHGTPQYELARQLRITETRMSRIACGRLAPTPEEAAKLSEILGVPVDELFPELSPPGQSPAGGEGAARKIAAGKPSSDDMGAPQRSGGGRRGA